MKNKGLIVTLIILLSIVIVLLVMVLMMSLKGDVRFINRSIHIGTKSTKIIYDKQFEVEDINELDIKQDAGNTIIKEAKGDSIQVVLYGDHEEDAQVEIGNGKLLIDNSHRGRSTFSFFSLGLISNDVIVYIPSHYANKINIKNDCGKCEIADLANATVNIDCDAGDIELGKIKNANLKCDCGNIQINEVNNKCEIEADCGNVKIDKLSIAENSSIKVDMGNIDINQTNDIYIDANVDLGKEKINNNNRNAEITLTINCDCGNVAVN